MKRHISAEGLQVRNALRVAVASCLLGMASPVFAQSASSTLRGQVTVADSPGQTATVKATNTQTGFARTVQTDGDGSYNVAGLPPGTYQIEATANGLSTSQIVVLQVGQIATLDLGVGQATKDLESVTVTATQLYETKTSEVSNYVSLKEIESLPQNSRNFLAFADTIPGVQFITGTDGSTELRSGAQSANGVNVFIDGVGQKNYVLRGGVSGQTNTRGNPFPQLAIGEYKVITSNYKAEFDQLSSAAIVAVTKSGTNEFHSSGFYDHTSEAWRASDPKETLAGKKAESEQDQYGISFGGPIIRDKMHFFVTYEGKEFETPKTVSYGFGRTSVPGFDQYIGPTSAPFKEDLIFGKIDWTPADDHLLELTVKVRDESEISGVGDQASSEYGSTRDNKEKRVDLRYQYTGPRFLNDMHLTYEDASYNPRPVTDAPGYRLTTANENDVILRVGGGADYQDKGQKGYAFQNDVTLDAFEWLGAHTVKTGIKYKRIEINAFEQQPYNPQFDYDVNGDLVTPFRVQFGAVLPGFNDPNVTSQNKQFGIYLQDDWDVNDKLQLNLGIRWDYEETPSYLNYETPADVVAGLNAIDPRADPALNQTFAQTLALGGIDVNDYISTGNNRDAFKDAFQPRLGFSYDLDADERHVIFGGLGRAYDRNVFDYLAVESSKGTFPTYTRRFDVAGHPCAVGTGDCVAWDESYFERENLEALVASNPSLGREVNMINNDLKTPYSDQISLGMRNRITFVDLDWNTSVAVSHVESKDGIAFLLGNRYPDGTFRPPGTIWEGQPWGNGIPGLGTLIVAMNGLETRANQFLAEIEKPYSPESGWSMTLAYTFTDAEENRAKVGESDEHYIFDFGAIDDYGWHSATGVPKHRIVATGIYDAPWDITLSGKLTLASPVYYEATNCYRDDTIDATSQCIVDPYKNSTTFQTRQFDLAASKGWKIWGDREVRLRADVLNVFNNENPNGYDNWRGGPHSPNQNFGTANSWAQPTRTFKLSFSFDL